MNMINCTIAEFTRQLASDAPAPGGGSAAGLEGALGTALTSMVCALTLGRDKYALYQTFSEDTINRAAAIRKSFEEEIDADIDAFNALSRAMKLPKDSEMEKEERKHAIQKELHACTRVPLQELELCEQAISLCGECIGKTNVNAVSDIGAAAAALRAAAQSAYLNVLINVNSIHDKEKASSYQAEAEIRLKNVINLSDGIMEKVISALRK